MTTLSRDNTSFRILWNRLCAAGLNDKALARCRRKGDTNEVHAFAILGSGRLAGDPIDHDRLIAQAELASAQTGRSVDSFLRHYDAAAFEYAELAAS